MLLRDVPEGAVVLDDGLTDAPVSGVDWLDPHGGTVDLLLADGTVRTGPGGVLLRTVDGDRLAPVDGPVPWLPPRWDARRERVDRVRRGGPGRRPGRGRGGRARRVRG